MAGTTWRDIPVSPSRPRLFWEDGRTRSGWLTVGFTTENRYGGAVSASPPPQLQGGDYREAIDTTRVDVGGSYQQIVRGSVIFNGRVAGTLQRHDHQFGSITEHDRHTNVFAEASVRGLSGRHTWVGGVAFERESFDPLDVPRFAYFHRVPGLFGQDDIRCLGLVDRFGERAPRSASHLRHLLQPARVGVDPMERLDQPRLGRHRLFRLDAAHRGNRSGRPHAIVDAGAARSRNRQELFDRRDSRRWAWYR